MHISKARAVDQFVTAMTRTGVPDVDNDEICRIRRAVRSSAHV
jgi:hypothetical protein